MKTKYVCYYWFTGFRWRYSVRPINNPSNDLFGGWHLTASGAWKRRKKLKSIYKTEIKFINKKP